MDAKTDDSDTKVPEPMAPKNSKYPTLKANQKIVAPQPKGDSARKIALTREIAKYGQDRVLENPEDCVDGVLIQLGPKTVRTL